MGKSLEPVYALYTTVNRLRVVLCGQGLSHHNSGFAEFFLWCSKSFYWGCLVEPSKSLYLLFFTNKSPHFKLSADGCIRDENSISPRPLNQ